MAYRPGRTNVADPLSYNPACRLFAAVNAHVLPAVLNLTTRVFGLHLLNLLNLLNALNLLHSLSLLRLPQLQ